jgi:hypothetical protein
MGRVHVASAIAIALVLASPAAARPRADTRPGPCPLHREQDEAIQDLARRLIECAVARWPVPGGAPRAICIARRESGLIPWASSATGQYLGLFQQSAAGWPERFDAWTQPAWELKNNALNGRSNAIVTIRMVNADGWGAWAGPGC